MNTLTKCFSLGVLLFSLTSLQAQVGIGTTNPDASAILELEATDKGLLPPRITTAQRDAISNPAEGLMIYNTDEKCMQWYDTNGWYDGCSGPTYPLVASLDCANANNNGTLANGQAANGVDSEIPYTGGNGLSHSGQTVNSTGVTGLTATLAAGTLATGAGSLTYTISGTPASDGTASFAISIGGQTCSLERTVIPPSPCAGVTAPSGYGLVESSGKCWLDRNLGASQVAQNSTEQASYGDLYQWGRGADGHQDRNSSTSSEQSTSSSPGAKFIIGSNNWYTGTDPDDLWKEDGTGVNNPCPNGFRLPTEAEWNAELTSWGSQDAEGASSSPLALPVAGYRFGDGVYNDGTNGYYWSSTVSSTNSRSLVIKSSNANMNNNNRALGYSVRCLKN